MTAVTRLGFFILNCELFTMPSGSSGRYQSRIFNFVHQQSRRLTEQLEHTVRYVQVATKWGVEVLLYPVYRLLHSSQSSNKTLYSREPQTRLQLEPGTPPTADTPIQNVLETVKNLPFAEAIATPSNGILSPANPLSLLQSLWLKVVPPKASNHSSLPQSLTITENPALTHSRAQGIATHIENRNLLLIAGNNEILDILTPQQQAKLEDLIISEIANYWRSWRLLQVKKQTSLLPEIERLLTKLTGGKPEQPPALTPITETAELDESKYLPVSQGALVFLDEVVANLESNALVPIQQRSREIIQVAQTQFSIFLYGKEHLAGRGEITANADDLETQALNIPDLIAAALNYFFGVGTVKKLDFRETETKLSGKRLPLSSKRKFKNQILTADPWLTWSDLFSDSEASVEQPVTRSPSINPALNSNSSAAPSASNKWINRYQNFLKVPQINAGLVKNKKSPHHLTSTHKKTGKVTSAKSNNSRVTKPKRDIQKGKLSQYYQSNQLEAKPDWIETKATLIGYEKHILPQILELLDSIILWLETIFVNIIMFLRGLLRIK
jgi:hypothetical protein